MLILSECREKEWKWVEVAKTFMNRNQHQIKNRFIYIMSKGLECKKKNVHEMIKRKSLDAAVLSVLEGMRSDPKSNQRFYEYDNQTKENDSSFQILQEDQNSLVSRNSLYFSLDFCN